MEIEVGQTDDRKRPDQPTDTFYVSIGTTLANNQDWTLLQGGFKLHTNGPLTSLHFTIKSNDTDKDLFDFMVDSVSITENNWRAQADARIEQYRKRDVKLSVVNTSGKAQPNVDVKIEQVSHHFAFGSTLNAAFDNEADTRYADFFKEHFEWGTIEWGAQWKAIQWSENDNNYDLPDKSVAFAKENGINLRGHALCWPDYRFRPEWLNGLEGGQLRIELEKRIRDVTTRYKSELVHWDVCNESLNYSFFRDALGGVSIEPWMFQQARVHEPDVKLCLNEFGIVTSQLKAQRYRDKIIYHQENDADVGGIGVQSHFLESFVSPKSIEISLDELKKLGPEIWFTEFDVSNIDPDQRAIALETFYRYVFSVPEVKGIIMWGFWAGPPDENGNYVHWRGPNAALVEENWELNAAGEKYFELVDEKWTTTITSGLNSNSVGEANFRGFHGDYLVTMTDPSGVKNYHFVSVPPGSGELEVELVINSVPDSLTVYGTDGDDLFEYDLGDTSKVFVNKEPIFLSSLADDITSVYLQGLGGTDHLEVKTKEADGRARIIDRELTWIDDGSTVGYTNIETVNLVAQTSGSTARIFDSAGDDTFESYADQSTFTTRRTSITVKGFRNVYARSRVGNDTATLFDSIDVDTIYSDMSAVNVQGISGNRRAIKFPQTEVVSIVGNDKMNLVLPKDAKTISVSPAEATVTLNEVTHRFTGIPRVTIRGADENTDTVLLTGSAGDDTLRIKPESTLFDGADFQYYFIGIPNFKTAPGQDLGGTDRLIFFDTAGSEILNAFGDNVVISGPGYSHDLRFFDIINAYSQSGDEDTAVESSPNGRLRLIGEWK